MRRLSRHLSYANLVATMALFLALGGGAYAAVKVGTKDIKNGAVTAAKVKNKSLGLRDFKRPASLQGKTGPAGPQGVAGPQGAQGPEGPVDAKYWAVYRDGLDRSSPGVSLVSVTSNSVVLDFDSDIRQCAWVAGMGQKDASGLPATFVGTALADPTRNDRVVVQAYDHTGGPATPLFHLAVFC